MTAPSTPLTEPATSSKRRRPRTGNLPIARVLPLDLRPPCCRLPNPAHRRPLRGRLAEPDARRPSLRHNPHPLAHRLSEHHRRLHTQVPDAARPQDLRLGPQRRHRRRRPGTLRVRDYRCGHH